MFLLRIVNSVKELYSYSHCIVCQLYSIVIGFILNHHPHISSSAGYVQCVSFPLLDPLGAVPPLPGHWAQQACGLPMFAMNPATHNTRTDKNLSIEIL